MCSVHTPAYPLPSSFPNIFLPEDVISSAQASKSASTSGPSSGRRISLLSTLHTTAGTAEILRGYANLTQACVARRYRGLDAAGLELDELRDMVERLKAMADAYAAEGVESEEEIDEDLDEDAEVE